MLRLLITVSLSRYLTTKTIELGLKPLPQLCEVGLVVPVLVLEIFDFGFGPNDTLAHLDPDPCACAGKAQNRDHDGNFFVTHALRQYFCCEGDSGCVEHLKVAGAANLNAKSYFGGAGTV